MTATTTADRLGFEWAAVPGGWELTIAERLKTKTKEKRYLVERGQWGEYLFAKAPDETGELSEDVYAVKVWADGRTHCTCKGASCRKQALVCRHALAVMDLEQGGANG